MAIRVVEILRKEEVEQYLAGTRSIVSVRPDRRVRTRVKSVMKFYLTDDDIQVTREVVDNVLAFRYAQSEFKRYKEWEVCWRESTVGEKLALRINFNKMHHYPRDTL